ncbi:MAG: flagellar hook-basal body complex protein FliE [bacterium]
MRGYVPKLFLQTDISQTRSVTGTSPMRLDPIGNASGVPSFTDVMTGLVKEVDSTVKAPDALLESAMQGNGADIHDVMIAMSKAEVGLNIATQMTTKVIQAYEKIMAIQV